MRKLKLAVISDIHVGKNARAADLCPASTLGRDAKPDNNYREIFIKFLNDKQMNADYLILPGDITDEAKPDEVKIASEFVDEACMALGVEDKNIVFVPGNHDVDWSVFDSADTTGIRRAQRYVPIRADQFQFNTIVTRGKGCVFDPPHFTIWADADVLVVGYNSSHHDEPKKFHHGLVDTTHLQLMRKALESVKLTQDQLRVFLVHHHLIQYDNPNQNDLDTSIMVNAEHLQALLRDFNFDILVHGHRHHPRFTTHSVNGSREIAVLCAGSFAVEIDTRWTGSISNQFHLITIEGRDPAEKMITGQVESWSYNFARGWVESDADHDGIPHVEPFGTYIRPDNIKNIIRPLLEARFLTSNYAEWADLLTQEPRLRYLRPEVVVRVLDELKSSLGYRRVHEIPEKIILLK